MQQNQPIHIIDRQSIIDRITQEYNEELYEIKTQFEKSKKILDDSYNLTIKQVNAMYDAYEVTLWQLAEYKTELLKEKLIKFPNFENFRFKTNIVSDTDTTPLIIKVDLKVDVFNAKHSILHYRVPDNLTQLNYDVPFILTIKLDKEKYYSSDIRLNNKKLRISSNNLVIKELDIVILWTNDQTNGDCVNIIKISTGELIYNDKLHSSYTTTDIRQVGIQFIYCNRQIMWYYTNLKGEYIFSSITIDKSSYPIKINSNHVCVLKFHKFYVHSNNILLFADERGLYCYNKYYIYFIGKLDKEISLIDLQNLDKVQNKLKLDTSLYDFVITSIDYVTCKIYIKSKKYYEYVSYKIQLNVSDSCRLFY